MKAAGFLRGHPVWSAIVALYLVLAIGLVVTPLVDDIWELMLIWLLGPVILGFVVQRPWVLVLPFIPPPVVLVVERIAETSHGDAAGMLVAVQVLVTAVSVGSLGMLCVIYGKGIWHAFDAIWGTRSTGLLK